MRFTLTAISILISTILCSQAPALIPYQAIARNAAGEPLASSALNARFTMHDGTASGAVVWQELQTVSTSALGLFTSQLGINIPLTTVNWAENDKFLQVELDLGSGFVEIGTQQLLSVPYALYAGKAPDEQQLSVSEVGDTLFLENGGYVIIPGISLANNGGVSGISAHTCGAPNIHNPNLTYGNMTDQEGNLYKTIVIGTQEWMAENLNTSIYRNGDSIPTNLSNSEWQNTVNTHIGAWAYYNNDVSFACPYGKLYNWYACVDSRQLCPSGWHVPSDIDWSIMIDFLDPLAVGGYELNVAGGQMKTTGTITEGTGLWTSPNVAATNSSGFAGIPGGYKGVQGAYILNHNLGYWMSTTENSSSNAWNRDLEYSNDDVFRDNFPKQCGFSVRCIRD